MEEMSKEDREKFQELLANRENWVNSTKKNKFEGINKFLTKQYSKDLHFIYEILQNSEDTKAKEIKFELFRDKLDIYHNGRDFEFKDIEAITGIGNSTKEEDLTKIGKFGVGFKSVFTITQTPNIFSGKYSFRIEELVIPKEVKRNEEISGTLIRIPFNSDKPPKEKTFETLSNGLENFELKTLLFLKNIEKIKWKTPNSGEDYLKKSSKILQDKNSLVTRRVKLESSLGIKEDYIVIEKSVKIENKNLPIEIAFKLDNDEKGRETIVPQKNSKLFVFFSTEKDTYLKFIIQGPYKTTPNRENIPLEDEQNKEIIEKTGELIADSLSVIKDLGYLNSDFLDILPIDSSYSKEDIYSVLYGKVKEKLLLEEFLPTFDGNHARPDECILARGRSLTEFLKKNDIQELYSKNYWLDTNITIDTKKELRDYLMNELQVKEVDFGNFVKDITKEFLQSKSDEWVIDFYSKLLEQKSQWKALKQKDIIRLHDNSHISLHDSEGKIQAYLPTKTKSNYKTVKSSLLNHKYSSKFLKEFGMKEPDEFAEVEEFIIPKYKKENVTRDGDYYDDFRKILNAYDKMSRNEVNSFKNDLLKCSFILSVRNDDTKEESLRSPNKLYFSSDDLKEFFNGYEEAYFVSEKLSKKFEKEKMKKFLNSLGVKDTPRRIKIGRSLTLEEKKILKGRISSYENNSCTDYEYEGLENFIKKGITLRKSRLLWRLLLRSIEKLGTWGKFFEFEYEWYYYTSHSEYFEAKFLKTLQQTGWLLDKDDKLRKPSDITFSQLHDDYVKDNSQILEKVLRFKPDILEQLPDEYKETLEKGKMVEELGLTEDDLKEVAKKKSQEQNKVQETWTPECEPENMLNSEIEEVDPSKIITPDRDLSNQRRSNRTKEIEELSEETKITGRETFEKTPADKKAIGDWGEKYVYEYLKEKYKEQEGCEIIWMNDNMTGEGYDFCIKKNGEEIKYIEVKSKTEENPMLVEIQGAQWEFARKLFECNEGMKYSLYVVSNTGKENAKIKRYQNPVKLWKEGRLYAHPVNLKL